MARKTYSLSDETFRVVSGFETAMAIEMECDRSYFYKIKSSDEPDRYPPFREQFRAACRAGAPAEFWLNDLMAIYTKSKMSGVCASELSAKLLDKIQADSESTSELVNSISDGNLTKQECYTNLAKLAKSREIENQLEAILLLRLAEFGEKETK